MKKELLVKTNSIFLKKVLLKDWEKVLAFEKQAASKTYSAYTKEKDIKKYIKASRVFFVCLGKKEVGTVSYEPQKNDAAYFDGLTILPEYRGRGLALAAFFKIKNSLKNKKRLWLVVHPENTAAIIVYLKAGFKIKGWKDDYYGDGEPRIILEYIKKR